MAHPDPCWRSGAIYRCCKRYDMPRPVAFQHLAQNLRRGGDTPKTACYFAERLLEIWDSYGAMSEVNKSFRSQP